MALKSVSLGMGGYMFGLTAFLMDSNGSKPSTLPDAPPGLSCSYNRSIRQKCTEIKSSPNVFK